MHFIEFMKDIAVHKNHIGKYKTAGNYVSAFRSFSTFLSLYTGTDDIEIGDIDHLLMQKYEFYLLNTRQITRNASSAYIRCLRATYNMAVEEDMTADRKPFRKVYTGVDKTQKRALNRATLTAIIQLDFSRNPRLEFYRDIFFFSFLARGMSFIDIAKLKVSNIVGGNIVYHRSKTGQKLTVKIDRLMGEIIQKYHQKGSERIFPIISDVYNPREYDTAIHKYNHALRQIAEHANLKNRLTSYAARHSWATIAYELNISMKIISAGMGHTSEKTTMIYLRSISNEEIDDACSVIAENILKQQKTKYCNRHKHKYRYRNYRENKIFGHKKTSREERESN